MAAIEAELGAVAAHTHVKVGFLEYPLMEVKIHCKNASGLRIVSTVWSLEVVASWRLPMYYKYEILNP